MKKKLFVIGDSNIYGDEQLNDNPSTIVHGILRDDFNEKEFNWPSRKTYPYYIKDRQVLDFSSTGLSVERCSDIYNLMILPQMTSDDELLVHIPPTSRDNVHLHNNISDLELTFGRSKKFTKWCNTVSGLEVNRRLYHLFVTLYCGQNINPTSLEVWAKANKAPQVIKWMDTKYWNENNNLSRLVRCISIIENSCPGKVYYVFSVRTEFDPSGLFEALNKMKTNIEDRTIDTGWLKSMNKLSEDHNIPLYPRGHYAPELHQFYYDKFVEKHFIV
tara:strand:- start:2689 stop:3510 length:822 start_codon:yes stop_codon:yes gene_type:complete